MQETTVQEAAKRFFIAHHRKLLYAAKQAHCSPQYFAKMMIKDVYPPAHIMKRLGICRDVRYYIVPTPDRIDAASASVLPGGRDDARGSDLRLPPPDGPQSLDGDA